MIYTVFDIETTGLKAYTDCVLQYACVYYDDVTGQLFSGKNVYLWEDDFNWSEEAYAVHKIDKDFLRSLPKEEMRSKYGLMFVTLSCANLMGFNSINFDYPFCKHFLSGRSVALEPALHHVDVMKEGAKVYGCRNGRIKLVELAKRLGVTDEEIRKVQKRIFKIQTEAHDATYDVISTVLCHKKLKERGYVV